MIAELRKKYGWQGFALSNGKAIKTVANGSEPVCIDLVADESNDSKEVPSTETVPVVMDVDSSKTAGVFLFSLFC